MKFIMVKRQSNKGFTMIEMLLVLIVLCICILVTPIISKQHIAILRFDVERIREICMNAQANAILSNQRISIIISDHHVIVEDQAYKLNSSTSCDYIQFHFTPQGTISKGFTLNCRNRKASLVLVAQLGSGRFDVR